MAILLRDVTKLIKFGSRVRIILQERDLFPDEANDELIWEDYYDYKSSNDFYEYRDYKVRMFAENEEYFEIYICEFKG